MLNPIFTPEQIKQLDCNTKMSRAIDGTMYMPGIVGLNNIKANDYCNVILQVCPLKHCMKCISPMGKKSHWYDQIGGLIGSTGNTLTEFFYINLANKPFFCVFVVFYQLS